MGIYYLSLWSHSLWLCVCVCGGGGGGGGVDPVSHSVVIYITNLSLWNRPSLSERLLLWLWGGGKHFKTLAHFTSCMGITNLSLWGRLLLWLRTRRLWAEWYGLCVSVYR